MIKKTLARLQANNLFRDKIEHVEIIPPQEAQYGQLDNLPSNIQDYLENNQIKLYKHQCEAAEYLRDGKNVLITTPTASGKTLSFNIPILERLSQNKDATALYIYPAKALANDQLNILRDLEKELGLELEPNIYDGDTPRDIRPWIRENSRLVLTNPYELHLILSWHHLWSKFYKNLKFIVIDEAHQYRGVFGSNVAFLIRRLRRICNYYGSNPQFILSSATLANPKEFGNKLTGLDFKLVSKDTSPRGKKYFVLYNPYKVKGNLSTHLETKNLLLVFVLSNLQTLCFTISRKMAEIIANQARSEFDKVKPEMVDKIMPYRAGYLAQDRRKIEKGLKDGELLAVTSTNALELGINIGSLDVVIISGYPGTIISTWQQAGRSGRGLDDSMVFLVAFENPLDQYFMKNPAFLFDKPHENAIIGLENAHIIYSHLLCASNELPLNDDDMKSLFGAGEDLIENLTNNTLIKRTNQGWIYIDNKNSPAFEYGLDQISSDVFKVFYKNKLLEKMDRSYAYREAHEGAVLMNKGETYLVNRLDLKKQTINVTKKDVDYTTHVMRDVDIRVINEINTKKTGNLSIHFGEVEVTENFDKYKVMNYGKTLAVHDLDLPPIKFQTKGLWFTIPFSIQEKIFNLFSISDIFEGGLHGAEHALISMMPLHVMCDRNDIGGFSTSYHRDTQEATIFIYDSYQGGIGLAEKAADLFEEIIMVTLQMVKGCRCKEGCPSCIYSPKCGNDNQPLDKKGTIIVLQHLLKSFNPNFEALEYEQLNSTIQKKEKIGIGAEVYKNSDQFQLFNEKGKGLFEDGKLDDALLFFNRSLLSIENAEALEYKAMIMEMKENRDSAIKYYDKALKLEPNNAEIIYLKSVTLFNNNDIPDAIKHLKKVINIDPDHEDAWYLRGMALEYEGNEPEAVKCYSRVLSINPGHEEAFKNLKKLV